MLEIVFLMVLGFILLVLGADFLIKGASNIAKKFNISELIIGLTIVAVGTSLPELIITIVSAGKKSTDLIIGNAIGSNICNLLLILGITSIINPISINKEVRKIHLPVAIFSEIIVLSLGIGILKSPNKLIDRIDGIILLISYLLYFAYSVIVEIKDIIKTEKQTHNKTEINLIFSIISIIIGIIMLKYGGDFVVEQSSKIATICGISERVIGLTIVAVGTALPELITSIISAIKKDIELATGNLIGSCILNLLLIIGVGAIITPLPFEIEFIENLLILIIATIAIYIFSIIGKKDKITRIQGGILPYSFIIYVVKLFI